MTQPGRSPFRWRSTRGVGSAASPSSPDSPATRQQPLATRLAKGLRRWGAPLVSAGLLLALAVVLDVDAVFAQLASLRADYVLLGAAIALPQLWLCAVRWRFTAARLGLELPLGRAVREYYVSSLLNQCLPTGVAGDALRTLRHGRHRQGGATPPGVVAALPAVVLERLSGQLALLPWLLAALPLWRGGGPTSALAGGLLGCAALALLAWFGGRLSRGNQARGPHGGPASGRLASAVALGTRALFAPRALAVQLLLSSAVVLTLLVQFQCASAALQLPVSPQRMLQVSPLLLSSMALPLSFAGWGLRELVAVALLSALGLSREAGLSLGVTFGLITLLGSAPGVLFLWTGR